MSASDGEAAGRTVFDRAGVLRPFPPIRPPIPYP